MAGSGIEDGVNRVDKAKAGTLREGNSGFTVKFLSWSADETDMVGILLSSDVFLIVEFGYQVVASQFQLYISLNHFHVLR